MPGWKDRAACAGLLAAGALGWRHRARRSREVLTATSVEATITAMLAVVLRIRPRNCLLFSIVHLGTANGCRDKLPPEGARPEVGRMTTPRRSLPLAVVLLQPEQHTYCAYFKCGVPAL